MSDCFSAIRLRGISNNQGSLVIDSGQGTRSDSFISSVTLFEHDYYFESPAQCWTIEISGLSNERTELFQLLVISATGDLIHSWSREALVSTLCMLEDLL